MVLRQDLNTLDVASVSEWHSWLKANHTEEGGVWFVFHKRGSGAGSVSYDDALDEALAWGWIDSVIRKVDDERYVRKFTPRRPGSVWSKLNIARVERLKREGRMTKWGLEAYGRRTSEISDLERVTAAGAQVPSDLEAALRKDPKAWSNFNRMAPSHRKRYLVWIAGAKRPQTRRKRVVEAVKLIGRNVRNLLK